MSDPLIIIYVLSVFVCFNVIPYIYSMFHIKSRSNCAYFMNYS